MMANDRLFIAVVEWYVREAVLKRKKTSKYLLLLYLKCFDVVGLALRMESGWHMRSPVSSVPKSFSLSLWNQLKK